jgi:integrase
VAVKSTTEARHGAGRYRAPPRRHLYRGAPGENGEADRQAAPCRHPDAFDWLVTGAILASNPATSVRGPKHVIKRGKTPVLTTDQARLLIESIDTSTLVGLRDRALIGVMTYAFARIGAVVSMRVEDYFANGKRCWVRLHEKGGKRHEMSAHHKLEAFLDEYLRTAGIAGDERSPCSAPRASTSSPQTPSRRPRLGRKDCLRCAASSALRPQPCAGHRRRRCLAKTAIDTYLVPISTFGRTIWPYRLRCKAWRALRHLSKIRLTKPRIAHSACPRPLQRSQWCDPNR